MSERPSQTDPRHATWTSFLRAHARVTRQLERELVEEQHLGLADYDVLVHLATADERRLRMSELADRLLVSRSGATRLVDRLEADGLVARDSCQSDRRGQWACLTDAGLSRLRRATPTHRRAVAEHFLDRIPKGRHDELERLLAKVIEA